MLKRFKWLSTCICLLFLIGLSACDRLPIEIDLPRFWEMSLTPEATEAFEPTGPENSEQPQSIPTPIGEPEPVKQLTLWLRPEFDPESDTPAGKTLKARLDIFTRDHKIKVVTRVKTAGGVGGMLDALNSTQHAAPGSMPDLVMLDREELISAARLNLVYPHQALNSIQSGSDWYPVADSLAVVENLKVGLPIGFDPLVMAYDSTTQIPPANEWSAIVTNSGRLGFPAADPQARFMLLLYLSVGGRVEDDLQRPMLELEPLTDALLLLDKADAAKHISSLSLEYETDQDVWEAFNAWSINKAIIPMRLIFEGMHEGDAKVPKPGVTTPEVTLADGLLWAISRPEPERQAVAQLLLESLCEPSFLAKWSADLHLVPARKSAVTLLEFPSLKPVIDPIAQVAVMYPDQRILETVGPVLGNAMRVVLQDGGDPAEVAAAAVESVR